DGAHPHGSVRRGSQHLVLDQCPARPDVPKWLGRCGHPEASVRFDPRLRPLRYHVFAVQSLIDVPVRSRRFAFLALVTVSMTGLLVLAGLTLSPRGFGVSDYVLLLLFALTTPWLVVGFWNAVIGLVIMAAARDRSAVLIREAARRQQLSPIRASTAILMCVRNESPHRVVRNLDTMMADIEAAGEAARFHVYILS